MKTVYFDNSATTPLLPEVKSAMSEAMDMYGNPSSLHDMGVDAEKAVSEARHTVLASLGVRAVGKIAERRLIFTASGTESDNLALIGTALAKNFGSGKKIMVSDSEHPAVLEPAAFLEARGFNVVRVPTKNGVPDYEMIEREADKSTVLASFMTVNNETGAVYDTARISRIVKAANPDALMHTDCVQAYMKLPVSERSTGADLISVSAHKIGGPKGVGALSVTDEVLKKRQLSPIIFGGGQESGMRSGTENLLGIIGFGAAVKAGMVHISENIARETALREYLVKKLSDTDRYKGIKLNLPEKCAPHIISITLPNIKSETALHFLSRDGIYVSSGSACSSNTGHGSYVLRAFGLTDREADCTVRVSLGPQNTVEDADIFLASLERALGSLVRI